MNKSGIIELIRPHNCLFAGVGVLIGGIVGVGGTPPLEISFAFAAAFLITGAGNAVNDYSDRELDAVNNPERPIPSEKIKASSALLAGRALFVISILATIPIWRVAPIAVAIFNSVLLFYYAKRLKKTGIPGNIAISYLVGSTFLFGSLAVGRWETVSILAIMAAFSTAGRELIKDIEDMTGDRKSYSESFPLTHGKTKAAGLAIAFTIVAIALSPAPYLLGMFGRSYLPPLTASVVAFIIGTNIIRKDQNSENASRASLAYKIGMGIGLIAFLIGSLF